VGLFEKAGKQFQRIGTACFPVYGKQSIIISYNIIHMYDFPGVGGYQIWMYHDVSPWRFATMKAF